MKIKCIKDVYLESLNKLFSHNRKYHAWISGNNLMAVGDDFEDHIIAYSVLHNWNEYPWFKEYFVIDK